MGKIRVKIVPSWFSDEYVIFKYSNNGIFWKTVKTYDYDVLAEWCYMATKTVHFTCVKEYISKFKTIDDVKKYEEEQMKKVLSHNEEIAEKKRKKEEAKRKVYNQYG